MFSIRTRILNAFVPWVPPRTRGGPATATEKPRLDIPIPLPGVLGADDASVSRLTLEIRGREGVEDVHVAAAGKAAQLCIHYDPEVLPLPRIRELATSAGGRIADRFGHVLWQVKGTAHRRGARKVADRLRSLKGVLKAEASAAGLVAHRVRPIRGFRARDLQRTRRDGNHCGDRDNPLALATQHAKKTKPPTIIRMAAAEAALGAFAEGASCSRSQSPWNSSGAIRSRRRWCAMAASGSAELKSLTGHGVTATLDGKPVWIGKVEMFGADGIAPLGKASTAAIAKLREDGRTTMVVRHGDRELGAIGLMDTSRDAARVALGELQALGIKRMVMISGNHQKVADVIAKGVGLDKPWGDLMPEDKVEAIKKLRAEQKVAMVGDGVNDAPAMASATVGIAMGAAGSDVALETADVALMADDLSHLPFAVGLSRYTRGIILQNVFISLGVVALLVPATILGLGIGPAVAVHEGSTIVVVVNALRPLAYRDNRR